MQNDNTNDSCPNQTVAEVFHLRILASSTQEFVEKSDAIHKFFLAFEGYTAMEILFLSDTEINVLIHWQTYQLFEKHLAFILNACPITNWFKNALSISHQPAIVTSFSRNKEIQQ